MKKEKKLVSAVLAFCFCVSLAGCGNTDDSADNNVSTEIAEEKIAEEKSSADEQVNDTLENLSYAYYDDLAAEYEKYHSMDFVNLNRAFNNDADITFRVRACIEGNKVIVPYIEYIDYENTYSLVIYSIDTKEAKKIDFNITGMYGKPYYYYSNGYIYEISTYGDVRKIDLEGNIVQTGHFGFIEEGKYIYDEFVTYIDANGNFFLKIDEQNYMVSSDFHNQTELATPSHTVEHGIEQEVESYQIVSGYDNYVCAVSSCSEEAKELGAEMGYNVFILDEQTMNWTQCKTNTLMWHYSASSAIKGVGKYILGDTFVYDTENGEQVALCKSASESTKYFNDSSYNLCYVGGNYSCVLNDKGVQTPRWYKLQFDANYAPEKVYLSNEEIANNFLNEMNEPIPEVADFSEKGIGVYEMMEVETASKASEKAQCVLPLNETYYLIFDNYGVFLRTYEKGESEEEAVVLYSEEQW